MSIALESRICNQTENSCPSIFSFSTYKRVGCLLPSVNAREIQDKSIHSNKSHRLKQETFVGQPSASDARSATAIRGCVRSALVIWLPDPLVHAMHAAISSCHALTADSSGLTVAPVNCTIWSRATRYRDQAERACREQAERR